LRETRAHSAHSYKLLLAYTAILFALLYADDTTLVDQISSQSLKDLLAKLLPIIKRLKERKTPPTLEEMEVLSSTLSSSAYADALAGFGMRENYAKRVAGEILSIDVRNLGMQTMWSSDTEIKIGKGWKAFWSMRAKTGGISLDFEERADLLVVCVRSAMSHGLITRPLARWEARELEAVEWRMTEILLEVPRWRLQWAGENAHDIRFRARLGRISTAIDFQRATFIGHTLRRGEKDWTRMALTGLFLPY
jgi:hypothetical protein